MSTAMTEFQHNTKIETNERGIAWVAAAITIAVILTITVGTVALRSNTKDAESTQPPDVTSETPAKPKGKTDFVDQGITVETCNFFYDRPGRLAIIVDMLFDETSICDVGNGEQPCIKVDTSILRGQSTKIEGHIEQMKELGVMDPVGGTQSFPSAITIHKLTILKEIVETEFGGEACVPSKEYTNP
jgi:hypothetical protein